MEGFSIPLAAGGEGGESQEAMLEPKWWKAEEGSKLAQTENLSIITLTAVEELFISSEIVWKIVRLVI